jgi:hypothetical protein
MEMAKTQQMLINTAKWKFIKMYPKWR